MKKILYVLAGNLSTTPRALHSILTAKKDYLIDIVSINRSNYWAKVDDELIKKYNFNYKTISLTRKPFMQWLTATAVNKIATFLYPLLKNNLKITAYTSSKASFLLNRNLTNNNYDLIIGHSYAAIFPTYLLSEKYKIPFSIDVEDFYPGETISKDTINESNRRKLLLKHILPKSKYFTYASPMIGENIINLLDKNKLPENFLINNCFFKEDFELRKNNTEKIRFVWFSQTIAHKRGLEIALPALAKYKGKVEVVLYGVLKQESYDTFLYQYTDFLIIEKSVTQKALHQNLSFFDIGLAIEYEADFNRKIALTNKIFAYAQSGCYILATDTEAQKKFLSDNQGLGIICEQTIQDFEKKILTIITNIEQIRTDKTKRFNDCLKFDYLIEGQKLSKQWLKF